MCYHNILILVLNLYSFQSAYPTWEPSTHGKQFLATLCSFRDQQLRRDIYRNYPSPSQPWQFTQNLRGQGELVHRFPSRDVLLSIGNIPEQGIRQPYILDRYYIYGPLLPTNTSRGSPLHEETMNFEPATDRLWRMTTHDPFPAHYQLQEDTIEEEPWGQHTTIPERLQSHFEASTSSRLLRDDSLHHHDAELHNMNHHWWARSGPHASAGQGSFLEPPAFGRPGPSSSGHEASFLDPPTLGHRNVNASYHSDNASERSWAEQEAIDGRGRDWRNNSTMSRTVYMDDSDQEEGRFGLRFANDTRRAEGSSGQASGGPFGGPLVSLPVRIIPRSNDPVQGNISL